MSTGRYGSRYGTSLCGLSVYVFTGGQDVERFDATDSYACKRCAKAAAKAGA